MEKKTPEGLPEPEDQVTNNTDTRFSVPDLITDLNVEKVPIVIYGRQNQRAWSRVAQDD